MNVKTQETLKGFGGTLKTTPLRLLLSTLVGGFAMWFLGYTLLKWLYNQQATSHINFSSYVGQKALVTTNISRGGTGEVSVSGHYLTARADREHKEFRKGDQVTIKSIDGNNAIVE